MSFSLLASVPYFARILRHQKQELWIETIALMAKLWSLPRCTCQKVSLGFLKQVFAGPASSKTLWCILSNVVLEKLSCCMIVSRRFPAHFPDAALKGADVTKGELGPFLWTNPNEFPTQHGLDCENHDKWTMVHDCTPNFRKIT